MRSDLEKLSTVEQIRSVGAPSSDYPGFFFADDSPSRAHLKDLRGTATKRLASLNKASGAFAAWGVAYRLSLPMHIWKGLRVTASLCLVE